MGLFNSLKAKTPLYGIPIWAGKQYQFYRRLHPEASEGSIADTIFFNRYERQNPFFSPLEAAKFGTYNDYRSVMIQSIFDLCMIMYDIECQIDPSSDPIMYQKAATIALKGLLEAGCGSNSRNILDFANRWYQYIAEGKSKGLEREIRSSMPDNTVPKKANIITTGDPDDVNSTTEDQEENLVECICGLRYSRRETRCPACGEELINAPANIEGQINLVECRSCGAQLSSEDPDCPNFGAPLVEPTEVDGPFDNNECPFCHAQFSNEANICPECGELIGGVTDDEEEPIERIKCPRCGAHFSSEDADCPACGESVVERSEEDPVPSVPADCLYCNAQFSSEPGVCPNCGETVLVYNGGDATFLSSKEQLRSAYRYRLKGDYPGALGAAEEALRLR
jgi:predicted amidophosphoribosyltransferase